MQDCLAVSRRGADQDQTLRQPLVEPLGQPRPEHQPSLQGGYMKLGGEQHIPVRPGRRERVSHR